MDAFHGGTSLAIEIDPRQSERVFIPLFHGQLDGSSKYLISCTVNRSSTNFIIGHYVTVKGVAHGSTPKESVENSWETISFELDPQNESIESFGLVVSPASSVKGRFTKSLESNSILSTTLDYERLELIGRVGEIRISPVNSSRGLQESEHNFIVCEVGRQENDVWITLSWEDDERVEKWEIFINQTWIGTAFTHHYRFKLQRVGLEKLDMKLEGFDFLGQSVQILRSTATPFIGDSPERLDGH